MNNFWERCLKIARIIRFGDYIAVVSKGFAHWELPLNGLFSHYILVTDTKFRNSKCNLIVKAFSLMWHDLWFCGEEDFSELVFVKLSSGNVRTFSSSLRYIYLTQVGLVWYGFPFLTNTVVRHNNRFSVYTENSLSVLILLRLSGSVPNRCLTVLSCQWSVEWFEENADWKKGCIWIRKSNLIKRILLNPGVFSKTIKKPVSWQLR